MVRQKIITSLKPVVERKEMTGASKRKRKKEETEKAKKQAAQASKFFKKSINILGTSIPGA